MWDGRVVSVPCQLRLRYKGRAIVSRPLSSIITKIFKYHFRSFEKNAVDIKGTRCHEQRTFLLRVNFVCTIYVLQVLIGNSIFAL